MKRVLIKELKNRIGKPVKIAGWVQVIRNQGSIIFLVIRDVSGLIQCVVSKKEIVSIAKTLNTESVVEITGLLKTEKQAFGGIEVLIESIEVLSLSDPELPIKIVEKGEEGETGLQKRLDWRWLDLRRPEHKLIFQVWTEMEHALRSYCLANGYILPSL
jgi:aspartyl-tRNA synthetase